MTNALQYLTQLIPVISVGVFILLSPQIRPLWASLPGNWPKILSTVLSLVGTTLFAKSSGDTWNVAITKGLAGMATTGVVGHGISQVLPPQPQAPRELDVV